METTYMTKGELRELLAVSGSDTREQIVYLSVDDLVPDPRNFYELSDINDLAENIALFGVQQPLRVREDPTDPDKYIIVSGHRRQKAVRQLVEEDGREDLRQVPCIVEAEAGSDALQELRLIYANAGTRRMTSAEISKQAERVEALLYQLKEAGYEFPGRMRDHVAEACKVSASKLARLKVIRGKLIRPLADYWERGKLNEEQAYMLSQLPPEYQRDIYDNSGAPFEQWYGWRLAQWSRSIKAIRDITCPQLDGPCCFVQDKIRRTVDQGWMKRCDLCCMDCVWLESCEEVCHLCESAAKAKREEKAAKEAETERKKEEARALASARKEAANLVNRTMWARFRDARAAAGVPMEEVLEIMDIEEDEAPGFIKIEESEPLSTNDNPFAIFEDDVRTLIAVADRFGCTVDYLLGRPETPAPATAGWQPGQPSERGRYWCRFKADGITMEMACSYDPELDSFYSGTQMVDADLDGWWPLPESDGP